MKANWEAALDFVWAPGRDSPDDGYHVTPGDAGGGTFGGVIEETWHAAVSRGVVQGDLRNATRDQLAAVLADGFWGSVCDALPSGLDLMFFNGRMMSGMYPKLFQQCLGFVGNDVDGSFEKISMAAALDSDARTLIRALNGVHYAYLSKLTAWKTDAGGWTARILAARAAALALVSP